MFKFHFIRAILFSIAGLLIGILIANFSPKIYEAYAEMLLGESPVSNSVGILDPQVQRILEAGNANDAQTELQLVRSQTVFYSAFRNAIAATEKTADLTDWIDYYRMYDVISIEKRANSSENTGSVAQIKVRAYSPKFAELISGQITTDYNELRLQNARNGAANAIRYLTSQVTNSKKALDEAENKYTAYVSTTGVTDPQVSASVTATLESNMKQTASQLRGQYAGATSEANLIRDRLNSQPLTMVQSEQKSLSPKVLTYQNQIAQLRSDQAQLLARYYPDHPRVIEKTEAINRVEKDLAKESKNSMIDTQSAVTPNSVRQQLQLQLAGVEARRDNLEQALGKAEADLAIASQSMKDLPGIESKISTLQRDLNVSSQNYIRVKTQLDELKNRSETGARVALVLQDAQAYKDPVAPDKAKIMFIGLLSGLAIGLIYSFTADSLKTRVYGSSQLSELTGLPVAATLPVLARRQNLSVAGLAKAGSKPAESFRYMANSALAQTIENQSKLVMFTGIGNVVGRSSCSLQFAMSMAAAGKRVLIVDCDNYKSLITKAFGAEGRSGLSDILDQTTLPGNQSEVFIATVHDNLALLSIGSDTSKSMADRSGQQVETLISFLAGKFDLVVFDMLPCDQFSDSSRMAKYTDEVNMVVSAQATNFQSIPKGHEILTRAGAKNVSLILTDASPKDEPFTDSGRYTKA